ncbi:MAG: 4Fe-4S dicluster domain-containing protein [Nitrospinales bacterium]
MQFRQSLNKEIFKGKKLPPKNQTNEDLIDPDQRGNHSSEDEEFLSLGKDAITQRFEQITENDEEHSRRGLFSALGSLKEFSDEVDVKEEQKKPARKKKRKKKKAKLAEEPSKSPEEVAPTEQETLEPVAETGSENEAEEEPKKGFFKRVLSKIKPSEEEKERIALEKAAAAELEAKLEEEERGEEDVEMDRRNLIKQGIHFFAKPAVNSVQTKIDKVNAAVDKVTKRVPLIRPPGAISEKAFLNACSRCDECKNACPKDAIQMAPKKMGFLIMGTPYIDPIKNPCVMCDDLYCISACPDKALMPVASPADVTMGYAILDKKHCQTYGDEPTFCQQCIIDCPIPGAISQVDSKPIFHKKICTGCGVCVRSCSTVNIPVAIKIKPQMVIEFQAAKKEMEKQAAILEAEQKAAREAEALAEAKAELDETNNETAELSTESE